MAKVLHTSPKFLVHIDPRRLTCDAHLTVLAHSWEGGSERPIYYASRSLAAAEKKYPQLDKEGLAIIFAGNVFHRFLYGRQFIINS